MPISIRDVDPQGADALALLHEASLDARALYPELFVGVERPATNEALRSGEVYVVAYAGDRPVACGALRRRGGTLAEVRRMYVDRAHRRQGLGRAVLAHLERAAIQLGYRRLVLETGHKQRAAMRLYESCGFDRIPPFGEYANDSTSVCYERALSAAP